MKLLTYGAFDVQQVPLQMHLSSEFSYVLCIYHQESVFANNLHLYLHIHILNSHLEGFFVTTIQTINYIFPQEKA